MSSNSDDIKSRVEKAVLSFHKKELPKTVLRKKKNKAPEKDLTIEFLKELKKTPQLSIHRYESKAVWSPDDGRYISTQVVPGHPDLAGCDDLGHAVYIELKAPGRLKTVRDNQSVFLLKKIEMNCFCIVADSFPHFVKSYKAWRELKLSNQHLDAKAFLLSLLPKRNQSEPVYDSFFSQHGF